MDSTNSRKTSKPTRSIRQRHAEVSYKRGSVRMATDATSSTRQLRPVVPSCATLTPVLLKLEMPKTTSLDSWNCWTTEAWYFIDIPLCYIDIEQLASQELSTLKSKNSQEVKQPRISGNTGSQSDLEYSLAQQNILKVRIRSFFLHIIYFLWKNKMS